MNYKAEYITRLFKRTKLKAYENYVISRIWHRLDNDQVYIKIQQYIKKDSNNYVLTDLFFPQFNIIIEVNEQAHYLSDKNVLRDELRKSFIENKTRYLFRVIDCRKSLSEIHKDIDNIIKEIKIEIKKQKQNKKFKPWDPEKERNPIYWKKKNIITSEDEVMFNNIEDICKLFDADFSKTKRGFLRQGGINHPELNNVLIWWPSENIRQGWVNKLNFDKNKITEGHIDNDKSRKHYESTYNSDQIRYVFFKYKDDLGFSGYKFIGIFNYDIENRNLEKKTIWKKIGDKIILKPIKND